MLQNHEFYTTWYFLKLIVLHLKMILPDVFKLFWPELYEFWLWISCILHLFHSIYLQFLLILVQKPSSMIKITISWRHSIRKFTKIALFLLASSSCSFRTELQHKHLSIGSLASRLCGFLQNIIKYGMLIKRLHYLARKITIRMRIGWKVSYHSWIFHPTEQT